MTNEEAKKELKALLNMCDPSPLAKELEDALKMAIKALEQQQTDKCKGCYYNDGEAHAECVVCDKGTQPTDAVSREQALLALTGMDLPTDRDKLIALFTDRIQHLPPVTPQRPKGHNENNDYAECDQFVCSECGIELQDWHRVERDIDDGDITYHEYTFKYCPNCGANMEVDDGTEIN